MRLIEEDLTRSVIGAFYTSYNKLGYGFLEKVYVGALVIELRKRGHRVEAEVPIPVYYDGEIIGAYRVDLVIDGKLLVEVKAEERLSGVHERVLLNYLCCSTFEVGLVLSYGLEPEFKRVVHGRERKSKSISMQPPAVDLKQVQDPRPFPRDQR